MSTSSGEPPFQGGVVPARRYGGARVPPRVAGGLGALLAIGLALPLLVFASTGTFARYVADDYCWAGLLRTDGFVNSQIAWYTTYSPRYAFTFLVNVVELAGPAIVPLLPTVAIGTALAVCTWTLAQIGLRAVPAFVLAELLVLATLQTAPDLGQSLYWQTGMLTYLLPLILCAFLIGWVARAVRGRRLSPWSIAVPAIVTFVGGGLSETYLIPQNVGLTLALIVSLGLTRGTPRRVLAAHLVAALAGGLLALLAIILAPATAARVGGTPADLWLAISAAIATAAYQVLRLVRYFAPTLLLCLALPGVLAVLCPRVDGQENALGDLASAQWPIGWTAFWAVTAAAAITVPFCYFPSFYAQNGNPPARSLIVPGAIMIGYALFVGFCVARYVQRGLMGLPGVSPVVATGVVSLVLVVVPLGVALASLPERAEAAVYAAQWDAEDEHIRALRDAGQTDLTVPRLPTSLGENFVGPDRRDWFNGCVARYYGVSTIASSAAE